MLEASVALVTVATDAVAPVSAETPAALRCTCTSRELADGDLAVRATESADRGGGVSLATARVVVGGGRGVGGPDGFAPLEELAGLLGGVVGVSRVVTSEGWRPHKQQVGQTGTKITPELYLACGISGAIQHIAGCASAKHIIAINTDPGAPILAHAEYAVIGDLHQVIPALVEALREGYRGPSARVGQHGRALCRRTPRTPAPQPDSTSRPQLVELAIRRQPRLAGLTHLSNMYIVS